MEHQKLKRYILSVSQFAVNKLRTYIVRVLRNPRSLRNHLIGLCLLASVIVLRGGYFHPEADYSMRNYLEQRPFLVKIFNAEGAGYYFNAFQAREFSYIVSFIDAHFLVLSARIGFVHFLSLFHYLSLVIIVFLTFTLSKKIFGQQSLGISTVLALLYLTSPSPFLAGSYYRPSKVLVSLFIVIILYLIFLYLDKKEKRYPLLIPLAASSVLLSLSDVQGAYYLFALSGLSFISVLLVRSLKSLHVLLILLCASVFYRYYNFFLGPILIQKISGATVDVVTPYDLATTIGVITHYLKDTVTYLNYQVSYYFGNVGLTAGSILTFIFLLLVLIGLMPEARIDKHAKQQSPYDFSIIVYCVFLLIASIPLTALMIHYSSAFLTWPDLRIIYYNLPIVTLIYVNANLIIAKCSRVFRWNKRKVILFLSFFLLLNIIAIQGHYRALAEGHLKQHIATSPNVRNCIRQRTISEKVFSGQISQHADEVCVLYRQLLGENIPLPKVKNKEANILRLSNFWNDDTKERLSEFLLKIHFPQ